MTQILKILNSKTVLKTRCSFSAIRVNENNGVAIR